MSVPKVIPVAETVALIELDPIVLAEKQNETVPVPPICEIDDRNDCWETKESISSAAAAEFNKRLNIDGVI